MTRRSLLAAVRVASALVAALAGVAARPSPAAAAEHDWHAGASVGYSWLSGGGSLNGLGGGLNLTYGLTDAFNAMAQIELSGYPGAGGVSLGSATLGGTYVLDILQWVPYAGIGVGAADLFTGSKACVVPDPSCHLGARLDLSVPFGLDYLLSHSVAVGVAGRYQLLLLGDTVTNVVGAFARVEYVWGR